MKHRIFLFLLFLGITSNLWSQTPKQEGEIRSINREILNLDCPAGSVTMIDGPIELDKWYNADKRSNYSEYRILFLLREAWGCDPEERDLTELRRRERTMSAEGRQTYMPMVKIANMLVNDCDFDEVDEKSVEAYSLFKECSAIVEVKKFYGGTLSSRNEIREHAMKNLYLLKQQIRTYNPNVVIIGMSDWLDGIAIVEKIGGYEVLGEFAYNSDTGHFSFGNNKLMYFKTDNRIYIKVYHPSQYTISPETYCTEIVEVVSEWAKDMGIE